jgi:hypothetical protein
MINGKPENKGKMAKFEWEATYENVSSLIEK